MRPAAKFLVAAWMAISLACAFTPVSHAGVVVFDDVTTIGAPLFLKVLTKGRIFPAGGRRFSLRVGEQAAVVGLTGGDGYGYVRHNPVSAGLKKVTATSDGLSASGSILVLDPSARTLFVDVEVLMKKGIRLERSGPDGSEVLQTLSKTYAVIYLAGFFEMFAAKKWISMGRFPVTVVLRKQGLQTFERLRERGVRLHSVIGSKTLISLVGEEFEFENRLTFDRTFDQTGTDVSVRDWQEVLERLEDKK